MTAAALVKVWAPPAPDVPSVKVKEAVPRSVEPSCRCRVVVRVPPQAAGRPQTHKVREYGVPGTEVLGAG